VIHLHVGFTIGLERRDCYKFATEVPFIAQLLVPQNTLPLH
jgi:hypothetical protein